MLSTGKLLSIFASTHASPPVRLSRVQGHKGEQELWGRLVEWEGLYVLTVTIWCVGLMP